MLCTIENWKGERQQMELAAALEPVELIDSGIAENAMAQARLNAQCIGRLAALMVERNVITLEEAITVCNVYRNIKLE